MSEKQKQRALAIGHLNPIEISNEEALCELRENEDEEEEQLVMIIDKGPYMKQTEEYQKIMYARKQKANDVCCSLVEERFDNVLQYIANSSENVNPGLEVGKIFMSVPIKVIDDEARLPQTLWHLPLVEWMLTGVEGRRFRDLFFKVIDRAEEVLVLSFFNFNDKKLWNKLCEKAYENPEIQITVMCCPIGSKTMCDLHGKGRRVFGKNRNLTLGFYHNGYSTIICHDKLILSDKEAWFGSCNASERALDCSQFNIMLCYDFGTFKYNALKERANLFKGKLQELNKEDREIFGNTYREERKSWWTSVNFLTLNDQTLDYLDRDYPRRDLILKEIEELKVSDCLIVVSFVVSGNYVMKTIREAVKRGAQVVIITSDLQRQENLDLLYESEATILVLERYKYQLLHMKLVLINDKVYFGSANFTGAAFFMNELEALMPIDDASQKFSIYTFVVFLIGQYFPDLMI